MHLPNPTCELYDVVTQAAVAVISVNTSEQMSHLCEYLRADERSHTKASRGNEAIGKEHSLS